jgi:hypothetical protein
VTDLTPDEQQALRRLAALAEPVLESKISGIPPARRVEVIQALARRGGLIEVVPPQGRSKKPRYRLTPQGRELAASLPPTAQKRTARAPSSPRPTVISLAASLENLRGQLAAHEIRLGQLEVVLAGQAAAPSSREIAPELDYQGFRSAAHEAYGRLDQTGQTLGLVPIPDLRRALGSRATHDMFDTYLLRLHREGTISILPHHNPASLPDDRRADALQHPTAGLLYFVRWLAP